jgi:hypothetical protein
VAQVERQPFNATGQQDQGLQQRGVPIARHHLRRERLGQEPELRQRRFLHRWRQSAGTIDTNGTRQLADRDLLPGDEQALLGAHKLSVRPGEQKSDGDRLGKHAVRAPNHGNVRVGAGLVHKRRQQGLAQALQDHIGGIAQHQGQRGIQHIRRGKAKVQKARLVAQALLDVNQERQDIVLRHGFQRRDACLIEGPHGCCPRPQPLAGALGNRRIRARFQCLGRRKLDREHA